MILTILERLLTLGVLPEKGSLGEMRMRQDLVAKIGLSAEEVEKYNYKENPEKGTATWELDVPQEKEIELKPAEIVLLQECLKKKDKDKELVPQHLTLYEKIMED